MSDDERKGCWVWILACVLVFPMVWAFEYVQDWRIERSQAVDVAILEACIANDRLLLPEAAPYTEEAGVHPIVLLASPRGSRPSRLHEWGGQLPEAWLPARLSDAQLVVYVAPQQAYEPCEGALYEGGVGVACLRSTLDVELRELRSQKLLASNTLKGSPPGMPDKIYTDGKSRRREIRGEPVEFSALETWLEPFVLRVVAPTTLEEAKSWARARGIDWTHESSYEFSEHPRAECFTLGGDYSLGIHAFPDATAARAFLDSSGHPGGRSVRHGVIVFTVSGADEDTQRRVLDKLRE